MLAQAIPERGNLCTVLAFMPIVRVDDKIIQGIVHPIPGERSGGIWATSDMTWAWVSLSSPSTSFTVSILQADDACRRVRAFVANKFYLSPANMSSSTCLPPFTRLKTR